MTVAPLAGRLLNVRVFSVQVLSAIWLMFCVTPDLSVTNIRSLASEMGRPASDCRLNFTYDLRVGFVSVWRSEASPKLLPGMSPAT